MDKNSKEPQWTPGDDGNAGGKSIVLDDGKQVKENNVSIGETVHFRLQINTSNYVADKQIKEFIIEDTLPTGFDAAKITSVMIEEEPLEQFENTTFPVPLSYNSMKIWHCSYFLHRRSLLYRLTQPYNQW